MKWFMVLLLILFASSTMAQITVTAADVELQFIADPTGQWRSVAMVSIDYSLDSVCVHNPKGRFGIQEWQFALQADDLGLGKCIVNFDLLSLPAPNFRAYIIRARVRDAVDISDWVVADSIKIFGNPGKPNHK